MCSCSIKSVCYINGDAGSKIVIVDGYQLQCIGKFKIQAQTALCNKSQLSAQCFALLFSGLEEEGNCWMKTTTSNIT